MPNSQINKRKSISLPSKIKFLTSKMKVFRSISMTFKILYKVSSLLKAIKQIRQILYKILTIWYLALSLTIGILLRKNTAHPMISMIVKALKFTKMQAILLSLQHLV